MMAAASTARLVIGGLLASVASGILGGIVLGVCLFLGSVVGEIGRGDASGADLQDGFLAATMMFAFSGGFFGLLIGSPFAAALGHAVIGLNQARPERRMGRAVVTGAVATTLIVGFAYPLLILGNSGPDSFDGAGNLILLMSVSGALAGSFGAFVFFLVRGWIVPAPQSGPIAEAPSEI